MGNSNNGLSTSLEPVAAINGKEVVEADQWASQLQNVERRFEDLQRRAAQNLPQMAKLLPDLFQDFQTTLEELRVAEEELRQQNELLSVATETAVGEHRRYQELFDFAPDGYVVLDARGVIRDANRAAFSLLQVQQHFLTGKPFLLFVAEEDRAAFHELLERLQKEDEIRGAEIHIWPREGRPLPVALYIAAARDRQGRLVSLRCLLHDLSSLKEAQQRLLHSERLAAIGQTVTALAHEGRNALQRMQACLSMLALEVEDRPQVIDLLRRLQKAQDSLAHLFEDIREYAAPFKLERRSCTLSCVWREAWAHLEPLWQHRNVALHEETGGRELHCVADPFRLEQVFRNILDNALAACPDPVRITITVSGTQINGREALLILIRDNGPGIPPEQREKVFEPFYTTKARGTGLGMAIARRIVEAHGGQITVCDTPSFAPAAPEEGEAGARARRGAEIAITLPRGEP
jgi:PAS domain S-box-containing protein